MTPLAAELLASRLPPLMVAAERVAATVAQGVHGRRRIGTGDSFWQFRPFVTGDSAARIDWRQSAKSDRAYVRDMEWEAAQTVCLWRDGAGSMRWRSPQAQVAKIERAELLLLALAALLLRGGERVRLITASGLRHRTAGHGALDGIADALGRDTASAGSEGSSLPPDVPMPRHARVVLIGDFLSPLDQIRAVMARLAVVPLSGHVVQVLDPAEAVLPYTGRIRFEGLGGALRPELRALIPRVEGVRAEYARRLAAQQEGLAEICGAANFGISTHHTDQPPETALIGLYTALSP